MTKSKYRCKCGSYNNLHDYVKCNILYIDRFGDPVYKRPISRVVKNRFGDVVKVYVKRGD